MKTIWIAKFSHSYGNIKYAISREVAHREIACHSCAIGLIREFYPFTAEDHEAAIIRNFEDLRAREAYEEFVAEFNQLDMYAENGALIKMIVSELDILQ